MTLWVYCYLKNYFRFFFLTEIKIRVEREVSTSRHFLIVHCMGGIFPSEVARAVKSCYLKQRFRYFCFAITFLKYGRKGV